MTATTAADGRPPARQARIKVPLAMIEEAPALSALGVLMIAAGASYFVSSLAGVLSPPFADALLPWILLPPFAGELSLALWLAVKGVRELRP
jgi:hypothetical protein